MDAQQAIDRICSPSMLRDDCPCPVGLVVYRSDKHKMCSHQDHQITPTQDKKFRAEISDLVCLEISNILIDKGRHTREHEE